MLKEIKCDKFKVNTIFFHDGLNVVLGDDFSTNSIGKSSLLMIIDFVFGGNSFIKINSGSLDVFQTLVFDFKFEFYGVESYFSRSTSNFEFVSVCDSNYNEINSISIDEFTTLLKKDYKINNDFLSFRSIVNPYSRVWGKENYNVNKPLQQHVKGKDVNDISGLIKLFKKYDLIAEKEQTIKDKTESKKTFDSIFKNNFTKKINKKEFEINNNKLKELNSEIEEIKENLVKYTLNLEGLISKEMIELKATKSKILEAQSKILNKIKRLEINLENKNVKSKFFDKLSDFFDGVNQAKIDEIEQFHFKINNILKSDLTKSKNELILKNQICNQEIEEIDSKISLLLNNQNNPKFIIDKLFESTIAISNIQNINKHYIESINVNTELKQNKSELKNSLEEILKAISLKINEIISIINNEIHLDKNIAPKFLINEKNYKLDHSIDTGTGKSYSNLIVFDLTILELTELPFFIHDSPIFKNIGDFNFEKIIEKYSLINKQIFISTDGINKFNDKIKNILRSKKVVELSNYNQLFIKDWRN